MNFLLFLFESASLENHFGSNLNSRIIKAGAFLTLLHFMYSSAPFGNAL